MVCCGILSRSGEMTASVEAVFALLETSELCAVGS